MSTRRRTPPQKPYCQSGPKWVAERVFEKTGDKHALAPLTGQDWRALKAFFHLVDLYGCSDDHGRNSAVVAMVACLSAMQDSTRHLAKSGIPHVLDWSHEDEIWRRIENVGTNMVDAVDIALAAVGGGR